MKPNKLIIIFIFILAIKQSSFANSSYLDPFSEGVALAEHKERIALQDGTYVNDGKHELWHTITMGSGWTQSSWGRWKYSNAYDIMRHLAGDPYVVMLAQGWCKIDGEWYYFDPNNEYIMVTNCIIDGFQIGADGKMIKTGLDPNGMDYDTTYSYLKVKKEVTSDTYKTEEKTNLANNEQIYIANNLRIVKNKAVTVHKPIFDGNDKEEVENINTQFEEIFDEIIDNYIDNADEADNIDISVKISSISKTEIIIKVLKKDKNGSSTLETLSFDRNEQNLTMYSD